MPFSILILLLVFLLIAVRQVGRFRFQIWQIMGVGALAVLITGQISPVQAIKAIDLDVMLFLFGMFTVGTALEESGYLSHLSYQLFRRARTSEELLLYILFGMGFLSAFLMNDTLAIIGTPVVLLLAKRHRIPAKVFLLALAFAVTTGSVMSPIGNPQNLLIALHSGMKNPFVLFLRFLFIPTFVNLLVTFFLLKWFYPGHFGKKRLDHDIPPKISDHELALLSKIAFGIILILVFVKIILSLFQYTDLLSLTSIALITAFPILAFSKNRRTVIAKIDWHTLIFFAAMFILMQSVWLSNFFQNFFTQMKLDLSNTSVILMLSILLSQVISNVPLVALYLPLLAQAGGSNHEMLALAAGSTIAGNLLILGAASNVIIIQNAEKKSGETITFFDFARIGIPLTLTNAFIYWIFLK